MIKFTTAGESHGSLLIGIIEGIPANLKIDLDFINKKLSDRQKGYGRSDRMRIENDEIKIVSGVSKGLTTGNPIGIEIKNRGLNIETPEVLRPRPGHGDLVGAIKYNQIGGRSTLERASARETAMKVSLGSICNLILRELGIEVYSHVIEIGGIRLNKNYYSGLDFDDFKYIDDSELRVLDIEMEKNIIEYIKEIERKGDTLGGRIEIIARNIPIGIGSHTSWDKKLDSQLAGSIMGIQAIKAIEIGRGIESSLMLGTDYQDEIYFDNSYGRYTNNAGGIEAGISNGEDIVIRASMKPIPTTRKGLRTVNIENKNKETSQFERSDVCAISSASIVCEALTCIVLANNILRKTGGDFMEEVKENYYNYINYTEGR